MLTRLVLLFFTAIIAVTPCMGQSATIDSLMKFAGNIHQFNTLFPQEKVFIQFDNTSYYTGETIWFKAFVTNASTLGRAESKVLYVDLLSPTGVLLKQEKLKIVAGQADGSFPLLDGSTAQAREKRGVVTYPSGFYEIRAYTSYMLNFDNEILFSRVIAVYDPPKEEGNYYESSPVITLKRSETSEFRPKTEKLRDINASFYPEGGHLIIGKPCRVAFKVTDDSGFGVDATGKLEGKDIAFSTIHDGMGEFTFTPQERRNSAVITVGNSTRNFPLPQAEPSGYSMHVEPFGTDSIRILIDASGFTPTTLGLSLTCRGELMDFGTIETGSGIIEKTISMRGIPDGVCQVYLFDRNGIKYASRTLYHRSQVVKAPVLEVKSDKQNYNPFEKIVLDFSLTDSKGDPFRDRFCLSVRDSRNQSNAFADDLRTSMLLSSDLKGFIENPSWYFDSDDPECDHALDLLCLIQGWERYDWEIMTGQKAFSERHRMERSLTLNGWILNPSGKKTMENVEVTASLVPQDKTLTEIYSYTTDTLGYFGFDIGAEFYDKAKFTINAHTSRDHLIGPNARIQIDRPTIPSVRAYTPGELVFTGIQNKNRKKGTPVTEQDEGLPTVINVETGFLLPDVDIDEERMYIDYFTFKAYDVVKDVELELDKGDYSTDLTGYLLDKGYVVVPDDSGGIESINGWEPFFYVHDNKKFLDNGIFGSPGSIDTKDIRSIIIFDRPMFLMNILTQCPLYQDYLNKRVQNIFGEDLYRRLVLIDIQVKEEHELSKREDLFNIDKRITTVDGYSRPYSFYSPEYPNGPVFGDVDYRRTLYWNPNVITDEDGHAQVEFYNSSITKHFNVEAAGITSSGVPYILDEGF